MNHSREFHDRVQDALHCAICGRVKVNTATREATCGRDECVAAYYPEDVSEGELAEHDDFDALADYAE